MRAVRRDKRHDKLVRSLATEKVQGLDQTVFPTMREVMLFAAALGFELKHRKPLSKETVTLEGSVFDDSDRAKAFLYTLALAETRDQDLLKSEEAEKDVVQIFEEYASGGLDTLMEWTEKSPTCHNHALTLIDELSRRGFLAQTPRHAPSDDVDF